MGTKHSLMQTAASRSCKRIYSDGRPRVQALEAASELVAKNTRLVQENEALATRLAALGAAGKKGGRARGLFGKFGKGRNLGDAQRSSDSEGEGHANLMTAAAGEMGRLEAANAQLLAENRELTARCGACRQHLSGGMTRTRSMSGARVETAIEGLSSNVLCAGLPRLRS